VENRHRRNRHLGGSVLPNTLYIQAQHIEWGSLDITHPTVGNQWKKFCAKTPHCETRTAISGSICQI
jgi:hypothetical protein